MGLTNREPKKTVEEMKVAIGYCLSDLACPDDREDGEDEDDEETEQWKLSKDDKPGWVMGTITNKVQHRVERFQQKEVNIARLSQPGWEDAADYICERDKKYDTSGLMVAAVVHTETDEDAAAPSPITFGEDLDCLEIVPGILQMPHGTSGPGSGQIRLGSMKL